MNYFLKLFYPLFGLFLFYGLLIGNSNKVESQTDVGVRSNIGQVQLQPIELIALRTGVRAWLDADYTGENIRIAILHHAFGGLQDYINSSENLSIETRPGASLVRLTDALDSSGTLALQTIHALAPDANYYPCAYETLDDFSRCVDWFMVSNVHIIHHGTGVLSTQGNFQAMEREVERAARSNILWVNAAGDIANGYVSGIFSPSENSLYHQFQYFGDETQLRVEPIATPVPRQITLTWVGRENIAANAIDFDLEIVDEANQLIATSTKLQTGNPLDEPIESVTVTTTDPFAIRIRNVDPLGDMSASISGTPFILSISFANVSGVEAGRTIITPASSANGLTIGALQGNWIAPYSSQGPSSSGAIKPDFVAPGEIQLPGNVPFVGTSASSAIVTAAAALVWEAHPAWNVQQVKNYLLDATQDDSQIQGIDFVYGLGRLFLPAPPPPPATATPPPPPLNPNNVVFIRNANLYLQDEQGQVTRLVADGSSFEPEVRGNWVVFASARNDERLDIYAYNIALGSEQRLTTDALQDRHPSISPDGQQVAFSSNRDGNWEIYIMNIDGSNQRRLTNTATNEYAPAWSPDGQSLAYQSNADGNDQIYIHDLPTNQVTKITEMEIGLIGALWSPDGRYIAAYTNTDDRRIVIIDTVHNTIQEYTSGTASGWLNGDSLLFHYTDEDDGYNVYLLNIVTREVTLLLENGTWAVAIPDANNVLQSENHNETPVPPIVAEPVTLPLSASPLVNRQRAIRIYTSFWSLTEYQDRRSPGTANYEIEVEAEQTYRMAFSWCADTPADLQEILEPLTVDFKINGITLTDAHMSRTTLDEVCEIWETLLSDWIAGETYQIEIYYNLSAAITDSETDDYQPGDYYHQFTVHAD